MNTNEMLWYPQDANGNGDGLPLALPPGGTRDGDPNVRFCLALWASERGLDHAIAIREDGLEQIKVWITRENNDWQWVQDPDY